MSIELTESEKSLGYACGMYKRMQDGYLYEVKVGMKRIKGEWEAILKWYKVKGKKARQLAESSF